MTDWNPPPPPAPPGYSPQPYPQHQPPSVPGPHAVPPMAPPPGGGAPQPQVPGATVTPNAEVMSAMRQRADAIQTRAQNVGQGRKNFFEILGPQGQKWAMAYVGYEGERAFYFAGAYDADRPNFVERTKRFWKSQQNPGGKSIYAGDNSLIALALKQLYDAGQKPEWLRPSRKVIFQGFPLEYQNGMIYVNVPSVVDEQGRIKPMLYDMSGRLFTKLRKEVQVVGYSVLAQQGQQVPQGEEGDQAAWAAGWTYCFHEDYGRPFKVTKRKTGPEPMNVEYELQRLEAMPLPQEYRVGLAELWKLHELFPEASVEEQVAALIEVGYPLPPGYEHMAPGPTVYGPTTAATQPVYAPHQQTYAPPPVHPGYAPQQQAYAPPASPPAYPPQQAVPPAYAPPAQAPAPAAYAPPASPPAYPPQQAVPPTQAPAPAAYAPPPPAIPPTMPQPSYSQHPNPVAPSPYAPSPPAAPPPPKPLPQYGAPASAPLPPPPPVPPSAPPQAQASPPAAATQPPPPPPAPSPAPAVTPQAQSGSPGSPEALQAQMLVTGTPFDGK